MFFWLLQFQYVARSMWVHPMNNLRFEKGEFFFSMYRMNVVKFDNWRHCISAEQKLVITLRNCIPIHT